MPEEPIYLDYESRQPKKRFSSLWFTLPLLLVLLCVAISRITVRGCTGSRLKDTISEMSNLKMSLQTFALENGRYPTTAEGLEALATCPPGMVTTWRQILDSVPMDKWGKDYRYQITPDLATPFVIISAGEDGKFGTADDLTPNTPF